MDHPVFDQKWCCLACRAKFRFGDLTMGQWLECPNCHSGMVTLADGSVRTCDSLMPAEGWTRQ